MEPTIACAACGALVGTEEVAQGLAVRVSGRLLCPLCLDHLPGDAKVLVNQMRALRGMAVTTYRFYSYRHPQLPLFTFTTSALMQMHRRRLAHGEVFEAPPLPPPGSRPRLPTATEAARGDRTGWIAVVGVSILIITGVIWLAVPTLQPPAKPPVATPSVPVRPQPTPELPTIDPTRQAAADLTTLESRLRERPTEARSIADEAELLRDRLPPSQLGLRNRADALVRQAMTQVEAQRPKPPEPKPKVPKPAPVEPTPPVVIVEPPPTPEPKPEPKPEPVAPVVPVPSPEAVEPVVSPEPVPDQPDAPAPARQRAMPSDVIVVWPKNAQPLVEAGGLPSSREVPWPWPTGEMIVVGEFDSAAQHLALELRFAGVAAAGGVALVVHPGKAERTSLNASWTDGSTTVGPLIVPLDGLRWQTVAISAEGTAGLDPERLRLRLEDDKGLNKQRPFLIAGASTRADAPPTAADHPIRLPLLMTSTYQAADGWSRFRKQMLKTLDRVVNVRSFSFARAKVLLPLVPGQASDFRPALRNELARLQGLASLPNGNPDNLPYTVAGFLHAQKAWPSDGMDDLDRYAVLAFGWRAEAWEPEEKLQTRLDTILGKLVTTERKLRRPAILPVLVIGEIDRASKDERGSIDKRWLAIAERLVDFGIPVIDLRPAQAERSTEEVQRAAAAMLVDGLRQLDWLLKL